MAQNRTVDTFKLNASQIVLLNRGKGISAPNVQAAIEEIHEKLDKTSDAHLHRGEGENSVQLGPDSVAYADWSLSLGARSGAHGKSSVAIGDGAHSFTENGIAIGASATNHDEDEDARDAIAIGTNTYVKNQAVGIGASAQAIGSQSLAIGVGSQSIQNHAVAIGTSSMANSANTVSIGKEAHANADDTVAIGHMANANAQKTVAIGTKAHSNAVSGIALGDGAEANSEASIAIGKETTTWGGGNIALGKSAMAVSENAVAIGSNASAQGSNSVAIGPGALAEANNTIVLGTPEHKVVVPGSLDVLGGVLRGIRNYVSWMGPSDDVLAEFPDRIEVQLPGSSRVDKTFTLKNPGKYRIKGFVHVEVGSVWVEVLENDEPITETFATSVPMEFSLDFKRDVGVMATITVRISAGGTGSNPLQGRGSVSQIRICGTETDVGSVVIG